MTVDPTDQHRAQEIAGLKAEIAEIRSGQGLTQVTVVPDAPSNAPPNAQAGGGEQGWRRQGWA